MTHRTNPIVVVKVDGLTKKKEERKSERYGEKEKKKEK
jgi:hypothetical protein